MGFEEKHVRLEGVPPVQDAQGREGTTRREGCCPFGLLFALLPSLLWLNSQLLPPLLCPMWILQDRTELRLKLKSQETGILYGKSCDSSRH